MAYIHIKKRGDKKYYYLRSSFKKGEKNFTKDICYLGNEISGIDLKKLKKYSFDKNLKNKLEFLVQINKNRNQRENKYFNKEQIVHINATLNHYRKKFKKRDNSYKKNVLKKILIKFITENTSIDLNERNYPTIKETRELLKNKILPKNLPFIQIYKLINTKKILNYLKKTKSPLNVKLIEQISEMLYRDIYRSMEFRKKDISFKKYFKTSSADKVQSNLRKLFSWYNKNKTKIHPLALAILFHHKFEKIHPLPYSNGEVGRIILNYTLSLFNYSPITIIIQKRYKKEYFDSLKKADKAVTKDLLNTDMKYYKPLIDFMQKQFVKTYWNNFIN